MDIAVIGAGSWGTALAHIAAGNGHGVRLWARRDAIARALSETHRNPDYLQDIRLPENIAGTSSMVEALDGAEAVAVVTPSAYLRSIAENMRDAGLGDKIAIAICSKGVEANTGYVPAQLFEEVVGERARIAALSGPNHAEEVVRGVPAGTVVASSSPDTAAFFQRLFGSDTFRVYTSSDVIGVELCAAFKNVIAIAVGASYGLGFGDNTAAMLMTRGQAEMSRLIAAAGGDPLTCMGLAGTGDLIATCMSRHSRNRMFGEALVGGTSLAEYEESRHMVVEGAQACRTLATLSDRYRVELPITDTVRSLVWEHADPHAVAAALAARSPKPEFYS